MRKLKKSVFENLADGFKWKIETGILLEGDKLPSCRELAMEKGINPNTVLRAYTELEESGYIYTVPKKGVYVCGRKQSGAVRLAKERLEEIKDAGLSKEEAVKILNEVYGGNND